MPDITQPPSVRVVDRRTEGKGQSGGKQAPAEQPSKKVAETYEEAARSKPADDRITILGIPVEQITAATQAALAGLISEINYLRNVVRRLERMTERRPPSGAAPENAILEPEPFLRALGALLAQPPGEGMTWVVVLVHLVTYEEIRRSSGLLAANSALADVAQRMREARLSDATTRPLEGASSDSSTLAGIKYMPAAFGLLGFAGGSNLAGAVALPAGIDTVGIARRVREHLNAEGYRVAGIDMALIIHAAAAIAGPGESGLLALGRADHTLRSA